MQHAKSSGDFLERRLWGCRRPGPQHQGRDIRATAMSLRPHRRSVTTVGTLPAIIHRDLPDSSQDRRHARRQHLRRRIARHWPAMYATPKDAPLICTFQRSGRLRVQTRRARPQGLARSDRGRTERSLPEPRRHRQLRHVRFGSRRLVLVVLAVPLPRVDAALQRRVPVLLLQGHTSRRCVVSGDEPFNHLIISGLAAQQEERNKS